MHFPTWVDLKGQDAVPETVHHVVCHVDPNGDTSWHSLPRKVKVRERKRGVQRKREREREERERKRGSTGKREKDATYQMRQATVCLFQTDGVHSKADLKQSNRSPGIYLHAKPMIFCPEVLFYEKIFFFPSLITYINHAEGLSEAVKLLKADYLVKAINAHKMDQAIVFCRTKLDCDNIENYLQSLGGQDTLRILSVYSQYTIIIVGPKSMVNEYSCVCLHGDRRPQERKDNLQKFKV